MRDRIQKRLGSLGIPGGEGIGSTGKGPTTEFSESDLRENRRAVILPPLTEIPAEAQPSAPPETETGAGGAGPVPPTTDVGTGGEHGTSGSSGPNVVLPQVVSEMSEAAKIAKAIDLCMKNELGGAFEAELSKLKESAWQLVGMTIFMTVLAAIPKVGGPLALGVGLYYAYPQLSEAVHLLISFLDKATNAQDGETLNAAAHDLATAITILGVNVVLAILTHKAGKAVKNYVRQKYTKPSPGLQDRVSHEGEIIQAPEEALPEQGAPGRLRRRKCFTNE